MEQVWSELFRFETTSIVEKNSLKKILAIENQIRAAEIKQMEAKSNSNAGRGVRR